jgi:hypothetical protein
LRLGPWAGRYGHVIARQRVMSDTGGLSDLTPVPCFGHTTGLP